MAITINNTFSALTGGFEELDGTTGTVDTPTGTHLGAGGFHFSLNGNNNFEVKFFNSVSDAGNKYCIGVWFRSTSTEASGTQQFLGIGEVSATVLRVIEVRQSATTFKLQLQFNSGGSSPVGPTVFNNDTWYFMEVFFEHADPGVAELWVGTGADTSTQEISVTGKDMDGGGAIIDVTYSASTDFGRDFDMGYLASGATAASDLLGDLEIFMSQTVKTGATPDAGGLGLAGTAPAVGVWENTADTPLDDTTDVEYRTTNSGGSVDTIPLDALLEKDDDNIYYFDGSDVAPDDPDSVWSSDTNAADGSLSTSAFTTTAGTNSTNELFIEGTNAPSSGHAILDVEARVYGLSVSGGVLSTEIFTDGRGESLGVLTNPDGAARWGVWKTLTTPSGGWTWAKVQALESATWASSSSGTSRYYRIEINVAEKLAIDGDSNIIGIKGIWHLDRDGGSSGGGSHHVLLGDSNDGNSPASTVVSLTTTPTTYTVFRTTNLPQVSVSGEAVRQGAWTEIAQDIHIYEMWTMIAHMPTVVGGDTTAKSITFGLVTGMAIARETGAIRAFGMVTAISVAKEIGVNKSFAMATAMSVVRKIILIPKLFSMVTAMAATPAGLITRTINFAMATAMGVVKKVGKPVDISMGTGMAVVKEIQTTKSISMVTAPALARKIILDAKTFGMVTSMATTPALLSLHSAAFGMVTAMSRATVFTAFRSISFGMLTGMATTKTVKLTRAVAMGLAMATAKTVKLTKSIGMGLAMTLSTGLQFFRSFAVAMVTAMAAVPALLSLHSAAFGMVTSISTVAEQIGGVVAALYRRFRGWRRHL